MILTAYLTGSDIKLERAMYMEEKYENAFRVIPLEIRAAYSLARILQNYGILEVRKERVEPGYTLLAEFDVDKLIEKGMITNDDN